MSLRVQYNHSTDKYLSPVSKLNVNIRLLPASSIIFCATAAIVASVERSPKTLSFRANLRIYLNASSQLVPKRGFKK